MEYFMESSKLPIVACPPWTPIGQDFRMHNFSFHFDFLLENDETLIMVNKNMGYITHTKKVPSNRDTIIKSFLGGLFVGLSISAIGILYEKIKLG